MTNLLAIRPGALGDTLLTLPALRALRKRFPQSRLHLMGHRGSGALLQAAGEIDAFTDFDSPQIASLFSAGSSLSTLESLRPLEAVVGWLSDPEGIVRSNLERLALGRVLLAPSRPRSDSGQHASDHLLAALAPLGVPQPDARPLVLSGSGTGTGRPQADLLVHPGSGSQTKNWPPECFAGVVDELRRHGWAVRLICGPADERSCAAVLTHAANAVPVLRPASVLELAQVLCSARAYLGNDSGVTHLAASLGLPTAALFGPTDPRVWAPRGPRVQVLPFHAMPVRVAKAVQRLAADRGRPPD